MKKRLFDAVDEIDFKVWNVQLSYINEHMDVKLMTLWSYVDEWNLYKKSETQGILLDRYQLSNKERYGWKSQ